MNTAFLLTLLLGILWSLVGAVVAMARRSECPIWSFYTCGSLLSTFLLVACGFCSPGELLNCGCSMIVFLALGALLNALGQALSMYNLRGGARALIFAIPQMNFVVVFLFSVLFLQERTSLFAVTGIVLLCTAILGINFLGQKCADTTLPNRRQLFLCIAAALIVGLGHCSMLLAGNGANETISAGTKSVGILFFSALSYASGMISERRKIISSGKMILKYGGAWAVLAALSYYVLFDAIEAMNKIGRGGLVFAIGGSVAILVFWCFSAVRMRDRVSWKQALLMTLIILGVILLRL